MIYRKVEKRIWRRDLRHDALECRMHFNCGRPLDRPEIAATNHSNISVRPVLFGGPVDRVITVLTLVHKRFPFAVAIVAPALILDYVHVPTFRPPLAFDLRQVVAAVWRPLENDRMFRR